MDGRRGAPRPRGRREFFDRSLTSDDAAIFPAEDDGRLIGAVNLTLWNGVVDLGMFVAGERRGGGVGSALVEAALDWARQVGAHKVSLAVWAHNHPARSLYAKFGFLTEGTRRRHYRRRNGELWDAVNMGLILDRTTPGGPGAGRHQPPAPLTLPVGGITAGGGLVLRTWRATDVPAVVAAVSDPEIYRWLDGIPQPYTATDAEEFILTTRRDLAEGRAAGLAVTDAGELVGAIGLRLDPGNPGLGEIGYWVAAAARGGGVATRATRALSDWGFDSLGLRRVELYAAVDNAASRTVAERAAFEFEGVRRAWRVVRDQPLDYAAYGRLAPVTSPRTT